MAKATQKIKTIKITKKKKTNNSKKQKRCGECGKYM